MILVLNKAEIGRPGRLTNNWIHACVIFEKQRAHYCITVWYFQSDPLACVGLFWHHHPSEDKLWWESVPTKGATHRICLSVSLFKHLQMDSKHPGINGLYSKEWKRALTVYLLYGKGGCKAGAVRQLPQVDNMFVARVRYLQLSRVDRRFLLSKGHDLIFS